MNTVKKTWPFEIYDYNMINKYVNDMANKGYALEKVGSLFATYEQTTSAKYKYYVDYINQFDIEDDEYEAYKKNWNDEGWEFVDFYDGFQIFRSKRFSGCRPLGSSQRKIREDILLRVKKTEKHKWIKTAITVIGAVASAIFISPFRSIWIVIAMIYTLFLFPFFRYLVFRKNINNDNIGNYNGQLSKRFISISNFIKWFEKIFATILITILCYQMILKKENYFFAKYIIILLVIYLGSIIYNRAKGANEKRKNKFDFESGKGKLLIVSIGMLVTIGVMTSFIMIDQKKPQEEVLHNLPCMQLSYDDKVHYIKDDYGDWEYNLTEEETISSSSETPVHTVLGLNKGSLDNDSNKSIKISFIEVQPHELEIQPNELEVRYWGKEKFENIKSFDEEYKTVEIEEGEFELVDGDVIYVVYAKWEKDWYRGFGYYVFSV